MSARGRGFPERFPVRDDDRPPLRYRVASWALRRYLRLTLGRHLVIEGEENIPEDGPLMVVSNHLSNLDPLLFGAWFPRTLFALAKKEMFRGRLLNWFFAGCNVFPIDRSGSDRRALRTSLDILSRRGRLLMFVEGTRSRRPGMTRAHPGVAFLARRTPGVRLLPAAVWGTEEVRPAGSALPRRVPVHLRYGEPFTLPVAEGPSDDQGSADAIATRIASLLPAEYRGLYAAPDARGVAR